MLLYVPCFYSWVIFICGLIWVQLLIFRTLGLELLPQQNAPFVYQHKGDVIWTYGLSKSHRSLSMAIFHLISRRHPHRWIAEISWLNCLILSLTMGFFAFHKANHWPDIRLFRLTLHHHADSHGFWGLTWGLKMSPPLYSLSFNLVPTPTTPMT